jgi:hypothetical protein
VLDDRRSITSRGNDGIFPFHHHVQSSPVHVQLVSGALTSGVKRPGREANHSSYLAPRLRMLGAIGLNGVMLN